jgi:DNA-binding CsgD family transcriptional regulator
MKHLYVFYFFATLLVGVISLGIATFVYLKTRDKPIRYYLYFYVPFTLVVVFYTAIAYIEANIPTTYPFVLEILNYFAAISLLSLIYVVPVSVHYLSSIPHAARRNVIFGSIAAIAYMGYHVDEFFITEQKVRLFGEYLLSGLFIAVMIYCTIVDVRSHKKIQDPVKKGIERWSSIIFGISLPGLMYDMFLNDIFPFRFYPLLYCGFSIFFTLYFLKHYSHQPHVPEKAVPEENFFKHYNISPREQEIVTLVLKGYSNKQIAESLYISLNTVKAHLRNIYPKLEVKSRYELITLIKETQQPAPSSDSKE